MISYKFNNKTGIVEVVIKGENKISDFIEYLISLCKDEGLPDILKIYSNGTNGYFAKGVKPDDMYKIYDTTKELLKKHKKVYTAFVISTSLETAMAELYKEFSDAENYMFEIFSTKEAAIDWLNYF
ncbi:MAG: hypothetical protein GXO49_08550 [Chlorobi bacterium]|nr:hypothetical protein [Chlorobiota bacterium]